MFESLLAFGLSCHQEFQVPKMEGFLNLIMLCWGLSPYISRIHTAYIGVSYSTSILGTNEMFG